MTIAAEDLTAYLKANAGIIATGAGVYPQNLPQKSAASNNLPAIVYMQVSGTRPGTMEGAIGLNDARYQFACMALDYLTAKQLSGAVRQALLKLQTTIGATTILDTSLLAERDAYDAIELTYRIDLDFSIWHTEVPGGVRPGGIFPSVYVFAGADNAFTGKNTHSGQETFTGDVLFKSGRPWIDVRAYGAKGDGVTDDTAAVQAAINAAKTGNAAGVVFFPVGIYVLSQITLYRGVSLIGSGLADNLGGSGAGGSTLQQKAGTDLDLIVFSSSDTYFGNTEIAHLRLLGAAGTTLSSGINFSGVAPNYGTTLRHLTVGNFALDGIKLSSGMDACSIYDIQTSSNGVGAGGGYGIEIINGGASPKTISRISEIYGDNNQTALIHLLNAPGIGNALAFFLSNIKGEKNTAGRQNDLILIDGMNGSPVTVINATAINTSGEEADAVIKVASTTVDLTWFGLNAYTDANYGAGKGYSFMVNDAAQGVTFPVSADGTSGTNRKFGSFSFKNASVGNLTSSKLLISDTSPTVSSGFGASPSIVSPNGTASFRVNVGTGGAASSGIIGLPTAANGWNCFVRNITAAAGNRADDTRMKASSTTTVTIENQTTSTGAAVPWTAGDILEVSCFAY